MSSKTISIDPQHFKLGNKKRSSTLKQGVSTTSSGTKINIHNSNIRELLLAKLQNHREKTQKKIFQSRIQPIDHKIQMNNFDEITNHSESVALTEAPTISSNNIVVSTNPSPNPISSINSDKPYGILKNGTKPTFKTWNQTQKNYSNNSNNSNNSISNTIIEESNSVPIANMSAGSNSEISYKPPSEEPTKLIQEREIKKNYKLGLNKKNKTISILIKHGGARKKIETDKTTYKKTPISTVKNYLKKKNFISFGATAPSQLMRDMYENLKLCGDVMNENPKLLVENLKDPNQ